MLRFCVLARVNLVLFTQIKKVWIIISNAMFLFFCCFFFIHARKTNKNTFTAKTSMHYDCSLFRPSAWSSEMSWSVKAGVNPVNRFDECRCKSISSDLQGGKDSPSSNEHVRVVLNLSLSGEALASVELTAWDSWSGSVLQQCASFMCVSWWLWHHDFKSKGL